MSGPVHGPVLSEILDLEDPEERQRLLWQTGLLRDDAVLIVLLEALALIERVPGVPVEASERITATVRGTFETIVEILAEYPEEVDG